MKFQFVKMQGCGNDYVYINATERPELIKAMSSPRWRRMVERISDRHTGVGSDGVICLCRPTAAGRGAAVRMRMFNADGSEGEMCGNGVRCVAKFAHDRLGMRGEPLKVQTGRGVLSIRCKVVKGKVVEATVDMGRPILALAKIPVLKPPLAWSGSAKDRDPYHHVIACEDGSVWIGVFVSMGNPHMVMFADDHPNTIGKTLSRLPVPWVGPTIENHPAFPKRINAHWVQVKSRTRGVMRTWERGAGETLACGTGACAALVAGVLTGRLDRSVSMQVPGGTLQLLWEEKSGHVFMTGPAEDVFEGEWGGG